MAKTASTDRFFRHSMQARLLHSMSSRRTRKERLFMRILIGVDGSPYSDAALDEVAQRAWPPGSEILVVTAYEMPLAPTPEVWAMPPDYYERLDRAVRGQSDSIIKAAIDRLKQAVGDTVKNEARSVMGSPKGVIRSEERRVG